MTCPYTSDYRPLPIGARVVLLADGARGRIAGWDHPGFNPRRETIRYHVDRDDGTWAFVGHDDLTHMIGPALRLVASEGQRVDHRRTPPE